MLHLANQIHHLLLLKYILSFRASSHCDPTLTQLGLLHEDLREGPADSPEEGGHQHHEEALQVELGGLERKHEEAAGDQQHHQDQQRVLVG